MLLQFTAGNFRSFKDNFTLSLQATKDDWLRESNVFPNAARNVSAVKAAAIYGANASGKSNVLLAIAAFTTWVLNSSKDSSSGTPIPVIPFLLHQDTANAPTRFEATFLIGETQYRYGFTANQREIADEWLFAKTSSRESALFTREKGIFSIRDRFNEGKGLDSRTRANSLFLSVVAQFNGTIASEITQFIAGLRVVQAAVQSAFMGFTLANLNSDGLGQQIQEFVRQADLGIRSLRTLEFNRDEFLATLPADFPNFLKGLLGNQQTGPMTIKSTHDVYGAGDEPVGQIEFDLLNGESFGTRQFLSLAGPCLHTLSQGSVLFVDELEASLHPDLTAAIVALFNSAANTKNAQLIFTTHNQTLLNSRTFRRDQIWFAEKNQRGESTLYSLDEIKGVRKDANFQAEYATGQYGGVPRLGDLEEVLTHGKG